VKGIPHILLNNSFVFQIGPLDQGFWPDGLYTAPTDAALKYDLELIKQFGWNMVRKHIKVEPDRWYYWADRLGLLVWQDMPSTDADNKIPAPEGDFEAELTAMINGRCNHPSIVLWVVINEGWGQEQFGPAGIERFVALVRSLDPHRLVINASGWTDYGIGDISDIHTYVGPKAPPPDAKRAIVQGEFGGLGLRTPGHQWGHNEFAYEWQPDSAALTDRYVGPQAPPPDAKRAIVQGEFGGLGLRTPGHQWGRKEFAYEWQPDSAALTARYVGLIKQVEQLSLETGLSAAVYTEITDVEGELNGFVTYDRAVMKIDQVAVRGAHVALIKNTS